MVSTSSPVSLGLVSCFPRDGPGDEVVGLLDSNTSQNHDKPHFAQTNKWFHSTFYERMVK